jgi:hypothetical protein
MALQVGHPYEGPPAGHSDTRMLDKMASKSNAMPMNMVLHGVGGANIPYRDTLTEAHTEDAGAYSLILANPPSRAYNPGVG